MRRAIQNYDMIKPGDKIAVGVSGGNQKFSPVPFELCAITVDMGFEDTDFSEIEEYCKENGIEYHIKPTLISKIVFDVRNEKNPCALCSNLKRGALHTAALEHDCNVVALGHHKDDAVETLLMSLFYEGRINCFSPVTFLDRKQITLIRPLIYIEEKDIKFNKRLKELPVIKSNCPADGTTKREEVKQLLATLKKTYPKLKDRVLKSLENEGQLNLWFDENGLKKRQDR